MAASAHVVAGILLIAAGGGLVLGAVGWKWLLSTGFRPTPVFKTVSAGERAEAEHRGEIVIRRFVRGCLWLGGPVLVAGIIVLAI